MAEPKSAETATLAGRIAEIPEQAKSAIRNGFAIATAMPDAIRLHAIELVVRQIERAGGAVDTDAVVESTGLSRRDASRLNASLSVTIGLLSDNNATSEEFVSSGAGKLFFDEDVSTVSAISTYVVSQRADIRKAMAHENLANTVLPSLTAFDVAVDVRFKFKEQHIEDRIAVAVVHIATDGNMENLWLQLSQHDVQRIISKMNDTLNKMRLIESLTTQFTSISG